MKFVRFFPSVCACILFFVFASCAQKSLCLIEIDESEASAAFTARTTTMSGSHKVKLSLWHFTAAQKTALEAFFEREGNAAIELSFSVRKPAKVPAASSIGFLYSEDFAGKTRLSHERKSRPHVLADFASCGKDGRRFSVVLCMNREEALSGILPEGFSVASNDIYTLHSARIVPAAVGFDYTGEVPVYAFAPNGGTLLPFTFSFDMSGIPLAFPAANTADSLMPALTVTTASGGDVYAVIGGERLTLRQGGGSAAEGFHNVPIPLCGLKTPFDTFSITQNPQFVAACMVRASSTDLLAVSANFPRAVLKPLKVDPGLIMEWRSATWRCRDYELFAWDRFPSVLIFDTATYSVQDDFFRRLAFFAEKAGYRGRLMSDAFLQEQHGYNAHDYRAETLASFFELARATNFTLNARELLLKEILAVNGIITFGQNGEVLPGEGAVISISQESAMYLRWTFIAHEGWHGLFFTDSDFRNTVASLYYTMDQQALHALLTYFSVTPTLNYDRADDYLMKNEFMAYMLQRPVSQAREYYINLASRSHAQTKMKAEADYILATNADGFVSAATMLDQYVSDRWNLAAGRVWLVNRQGS